MKLERDLLALWLMLQFLQCLAADEVVIELDERTVTQRIRRQIVVFDVVGDETAGDASRWLRNRWQAATRR